MTDIQLYDQPINVDACIRSVMSPECGGIDVFIGTVRNATKGRQVVRLEFEGYAPMAISEMQQIAGEMQRLWPVIHVVMHHRTGALAVGEVPVVIAVAAAHRAAAFEACRYAIDTLKRTVPIWKKEVYADGEIWIGAHP